MGREEGISKQVLKGKQGLVWVFRALSAHVCRSETMESLRREIQKARVLVQNFAPHLLTTGDIAVASE